MRTRLVLAGMVLVLGALGWAQSQTGPEVSTPVSPAYSNDTTLSSAAALASDDRPPSGAQPVTLGISRKKEVNVTLSANQSWDSNANVTPQTRNDWQALSSFGGGMQLTFDGLKSQTLLNYLGYALAYPSGNPVWTTFQTLGFSQNVKLGRWTLTAGDTFNYSPNSPFGGYGYGLTAAGGSLSSSIMNPQYTPNQSILTPYTPSYFNGVLGQVEYGLSRRTSWTASGSYGLLRFPDSDLYNTNQVVVSTGINHSFSKRDTLFGTYSYGQFHYTSSGLNFTSQTVQLGYSHVITGRISFQLSGGPQFTNANSLGTAQRETRFAGNASLSYSRPRTSMALSYFSGATGGSGVLIGSQTQSVQFEVNNSLTRQWTTTGAVGYSHNGGVTQQESYDTLYISPGIRRAVTQNLGLSFNYSYQRQLTQSNCLGFACGTVSRNFLSIGIDYKFLPIRLE